MSELKSGIPLAEGEKLVVELEAELWATSSNPIARALGNIRKFIAKICGNKYNGYLVITNKRVIEVKNVVKCYCFNVGRFVKYVLPSSVKECGYEKVATCGCFCPAYYFYYESHTQLTRIMLSGVDEEGAKKVVDAFYNAVSNSQTGAND